MRIMPQIEPPTAEVLALVTKEKAEFIEEQANKMYEFVLESRELLTKEAHTTLQWLFAIVVSSSGYLITLCTREHPHDPLWWVMIPLAFAALWAAAEAFKLIKNALQTKGLKPLGNSPQNLADKDFITYSEPQMRFLEAWQVQERVEDALNHNRLVGNAINQARWSVVAIPIIALLVLLALWMVLVWRSNPHAAA